MNGKFLIHILAVHTPAIVHVRTLLLCSVRCMRAIGQIGFATAISAVERILQY